MAYNTEKVVRVGSLKTMAQKLKTQMANDHLSRKIVDSVEAIDLTAEDAGRYIYMVPRAGAQDGDSNRYDEYLVIDGKLEPVGSWNVDLSGYATKEELAAAAPGIATDAEVAEMLDEVFGTVPAASAE